MNKASARFTSEAPVGSLWKIKDGFDEQVVCWLNIETMNVRPGVHYFYLEDIGSPQGIFMHLGTVKTSAYFYSTYSQFLLGERIVWIEQEECKHLIACQTTNGKDE